MAILSEESKVLKNIREVVTYKLLNDSSVDETTSTAVSCIDADKVTLIVETSAGTSGGVVTLEGARTSTYTGAWQSLGTITTNAASTTFMITVDVSDSPGMPIPYIRARVSTAITGGTLDAYLITRR